MQSVGTISLDLIIKENIEKQLNKFKSAVQGVMSKPIEQAGNAVQKTVDKTFEGASKAIDNFKSTAKSDLEKLAQEATKPMAEMREKAKQAFNDVTAEVAKPLEKKIVVKTVTAKDVLNAQGIADPIEKVNEKIVESFEKAKEKLSIFEISTDPVKRLEQELENTREKAGLLQKKWQELNEQLSKTDNDADASKIISQINAIEKQLISLQSQIDKIKNKINSSMSGGSAFESMKAKVSDVSKNIKSKISSATSKASESIKKALGGAFKTLKSVGGKALDGIKSKFSKLHGSVGSLEKPISKLGRSIKNAFRRVFVMAGILALVKALRSAITDAANGNEEFAKSLNEIKANLQIAFVPITNAIMPAINTLMSGLAAVTKQLAAFTSELFGSTYKKSLETVKKVKEVGKEAKKNATYLASFDEMNVAQDTSSESSSGSDDSGIDYSAINGDNVKLTDWAERMKDAIRSGDWKGVGALLAEKVNSALTGINWDSIQSKVNGFMKDVADGLNSFVKKLKWKEIGKSFGKGINTIFSGLYTFLKNFDWGAFGKGIADFLNGAIESADWSLIGRTLASKWNALIDTLYGFVTNFDWSGFGVSIGESVNAWFDEIDWAKLGETLSESIKGLFDTIMGFLETVDWQGIGEKLWTFVKSIDWGGIVKKLFKTLGEAIGATVSLLWGFIKEAVFKIRDYFKKKIQDCGGNIVAGLWKGITDAIKGAYNWIKEHVFKPFIDGFKKVFGIHSPSTVMAEMGDYIIKGLYNAISSGISKVKEIFSKMLSKIKEVFKDIGGWFKEKFSGAWNKIKEVFSIKNIKDFFSKAWENFKKPFASVGSWFKEKFKSAWEGVKSVTKTVWDKIVDVVKAPINLIIGAINGMLGAVERGINWVIDGINKLSFDVPDWVPIIGGSRFGFNIPNIDIPEIPKLATGGLATAPTLAMVGDNRNAKTDPEVIAPLSKLQGMLSDGAGISEIIALLREIVDILKSLDFTFEGKINERTLWKAIVKMYREHRVRTGGALI